MDRKFWIETILNVAMLAVVATGTYFTVYPPQPGNPLSPVATVVAPVVSSGWLVYLPVALMAGLVITNTVLLAKQKRQGKGPFLRGMVMKGNGNRGADSVRIISGTSLRDFRKEYNFAVCVGILDPAKDKTEDERMAISSSFSIGNEDVEVLIPHGGPLQDGINAEHLKQNPHLAPAIAGMRQFPKKRKKPIQTRLAISTWTETVLLPKGVDAKSVRKLSDVTRLNGKVLSDEIAEGRVTQTW